MPNVFHFIELYVDGKLINQTLWSGPVEGVIAIAKTQMARRDADHARVAVEGDGGEVWAGHRERDTVPSTLSDSPAHQAL